MSGILRSLLQHWGVGLAAAASLCIIIAVLKTSAASRSRDKNIVMDGIAEEQAQKQKNRQLLCGDARVLADLAIQRHISDAAFLRSLHAQPCYEELLPYFREEFRRQVMKAPVESQKRPRLAIACREEIDCLERIWAEAQQSPGDSRANAA